MSDGLPCLDVPAFRRRVFLLGLTANCGVNGEDLDWIWCWQAPRTVSSSKRTFIVQGKKVSCQRKNCIGSESSGRLCTRPVHGLRDGDIL